MTGADGDAEVSEAAQVIAEQQQLPIQEVRLPPSRDHDAAHFVATPSSLLESWLVARRLEQATRPGDVVVITDRAGHAGVFAVLQRTRGTDDARRVVIVAGHSRTLEASLITGAPLVPSDHVWDWEIASYRFADLIVSPSVAASELLRKLGFPSSPFTPRSDVVADALEDEVQLVFAPEPVSRRSQTLTILRALSGGAPQVTLHVSEHDVPDVVWNGSTWEAASGIRPTVDVRRGSPNGTPDLLILGDPFSMPSPDAMTAVRNGVPVAVPAGSAASRVLRGAYTWRDEDELAGIIAGELRERSDPATARTVDMRLVDREAGDRASRVSVGVPVFRDVRFLDECLGSIVDQDQRPHEIVIVDDGSASGEVDHALGRWEDEHPDLIRVLRQANRGVCAARNHALKEMTGDAFLFVDQDDVLTPTFISRCANTLRGNPQLTAVATWTEFFGAYEGIEAKPPFDARVGRRENPIVSTCVLVDMRVRDVGIRFVPELAWVYCEDWDFWAQIVAAGGRFGLVPEALAKHRVHLASGGHRRTELALELGKAHATARLEGVEERVGPLSAE